MSDLLALDNSQFRTYWECPRKYLYRYAWDLTPGLAPWFLSGRAWGEAMDVMWGEARAGTRANLDRIISAFEDCVSAGLPSLSPEQQNDWRIRSRHHYHEALADYAQKYYDHIAETYDPALTQCEVPFEREMRNFLLIGRFDKIVFNVIEESWWIVEHKTTSGWFSPAYLAKWRNDNQIRTYGFEGRRRWGEKFGGVIVDCASISQKGKVALKPLLITMPPLEESGWRLDLEEWAEEIIERRAGKGRWKTNTDACERYKQICPYFEACVIDHDPRAAPEGWGLRVEHWDPRERAIDPIPTGPEDMQNEMV